MQIFFRGSKEMQHQEKCDGGFVMISAAFLIIAVLCFVRLYALSAYARLSGEKREKQKTEQLYYSSSIKSSGEEYEYEND